MKRKLKKKISWVHLLKGKVHEGKLVVLWSEKA